ncbi:MAG: hypothetical protein CSA74_00715 [Rhodobacterales bacterium]|nr:MAG: hypothetical protein CSA74_00715 [Rhodobacterales bacterium]
MPDHFPAFKDPRQSRKTVCPISEVLLIVLAGVMAKADAAIAPGTSWLFCTGFGLLQKACPRMTWSTDRITTVPFGQNILNSR